MVIPYDQMSLASVCTLQSSATNSLAIQRSVPLTLEEVEVRDGNSPELMVREMPKSASSGVPSEEMSMFSFTDFMAFSMHSITD